jgi:hypothetical protein
MCSDMHCYTYFRKYHGHIIEDDSGCDERRPVGTGNERGELGSLERWLGGSGGPTEEELWSRAGQRGVAAALWHPEGKTAVRPVAITGR